MRQRRVSSWAIGVGAVWLMAVAAAVRLGGIPSGPFALAWAGVGGLLLFGGAFGWAVAWAIQAWHGGRDQRGDREDR